MSLVNTVSRLWFKLIRNVRTNLGFGVGAAASITTGGANTAIGTNAMNLATTQGYNVAIGSNALAYATTGLGNNTAVGANALHLQTTASFNTAVGYSALESIGASGGGTYNTAVGAKCLQAANASIRNTAVGYAATRGSPASNGDTVSVGHKAGNGGERNVALGSYALTSCTGYSNVGVGTKALENCTGGGCVGIGQSAGRVAAGQNHRVCIGYYAGGTNYGSNTVLIGSSAGYGGSASGIVAVGFQSLYHLGNATSGMTAIGYKTFFHGTGSSHGTAVGFKAGYTLNSVYAYNNTFIGYGTAPLVATGATADNNAIVIGASVTGNGPHTATIGGATDTLYAGFFHPISGAASLASTFTNATAILAATNLSFNLNAKTYLFEGMLLVSNSTAAEGVQFDFNGGAAVVSAFSGNIVGSNGTITLGTTTATSISTALTASSVTGVDAIYVSGFITVGTAGTLILRFAENTHATGTASLHQGSWLNFTDVPTL
jgi:hypothetical protein